MATRRRCAPPRSGSPESGTARVRSFGGISRMDIRKIKKLIELLEESGIAEIEIKEGEEAVRISRMGAAAAQLMQPAMPAAPPPAAVAAPPPPPAPESAAHKPKPNEH